MFDEIQAEDSADESAAAASAEVASDDVDAAAAEPGENYAEVADLLAGALISGSSQASAAALEAYNRLGRAVALGGPIKAALPGAEAPEEDQEQAGFA